MFNSTIKDSFFPVNLDDSRIKSNWRVFDRSGSSLTTERGIIEGKIKKYYGLESELFSGLFEGAMGAGTAIVSVSPGTGSIHANVLFKGIAKEGQQNVDFVLKFHTTHEGETRSVEESVVLESVGAVSGNCSPDWRLFP